VSLLLLLLAFFVGVPAGGSTESATEEVPAEPFTGRVFNLEDGDFVTYSPGEASPGDQIVCVIDGKRIEALVPRRGVGVSVDPMRVATKPNGEVRAECGGIHAETAPPGSW
jgi:hypothetical protein